MTYADLLRQKAALQRATVTRNPSTGDEVESWSIQASDVPCQVVPVSERASVALGLAELVTHRVHMVHRTDVQTGRWRAIVDGLEYRVVDVVNPGAMGHHLELLCRRMNT